jgi:hypothetical protein
MTDILALTRSYAEMLRQKTRQAIARVEKAPSATVFSAACYEHCLSDSDMFWTRAVSLGAEAVPLNRFLAEWMVDGNSAGLQAVDDCMGFNCGCLQAPR